MIFFLLFFFACAILLWSVISFLPFSILSTPPVNLLWRGSVIQRYIQCRYEVQNKLRVRSLVED
ncbi:uncharacterized protein BO95DRAFT_297155 [Aspergillus brunneoviolaceus CBS 621.78]|uniref:Uncharacterized protein n=1 Tax=Aspergillus brunneoviolaceus CBS 621.78 TaxID=1450534 RepID=A0ACD1FU98_9EURO|nr:hypothetical protein BO95DRAFT_297155 [Aspergillus brunneoviolaceus CBS 621.78]RAH40534.1 hypothetical protein BO95DRAFT_297155 [Aspergillus brunneoviolaceus CBS 621.78]